MFELCYLIRSHTHHQSSPCLWLLYRSFIITSADGCTVAVIPIPLRSTDGLPFDRCYEAYNTSSRQVFTLNQVTFAESRVTMEGDEGNNGDHQQFSYAWWDWVKACLLSEMADKIQENAHLTKCVTEYNKLSNFHEGLWVIGRGGWWPVVSFGFN